jgi:galacturan 1,4-alpha-galacturonidase
MSIAAFLSLCLLIAVSSGINSPRVDILNDDTCVPTPGSPATADDIPAIHAAFEKCGNGGTVLIPESTTYQIASPLNLSLCRSCTFQIDGNLNISTTDYSIWWSKDGIFQLSGAKDVTIKGSGLISGNDWKYFPEKGNDWNHGPPIFNISDADNIKISGLRIRKSFGNVFSIQNSKDVEVSSLSMSNDPPPFRYNSVTGFEVIHSSHMKIHDVSITEVYSCISIRTNVTSADISHISCNGTSSDMGIVITHHIVGSDFQSNHNISFSDLSISTNAQWATGIIAQYGFVNATDITWKNVQVDRVRDPVMILNCVGLATACGVNHDGGARFNLQRVLFQNFSGVAQYPTPQIRCYAAENGVCDVQVSDYGVDPAPA